MIKSNNQMWMWMCPFLKVYKNIIKIYVWILQIYIKLKLNKIKRFQLIIEQKVLMQNIIVIFWEFNVISIWNIFQQKEDRKIINLMIYYNLLKWVQSIVNKMVTEMTMNLYSLLYVMENILHKKKLKY